VFCQGRIPYPVPPTSFATLKNSQPQRYKYVKHAPRTPVGIPVRGVCVREYYMGKEKAKNQAAAILYIYGKTRSRRRHAPRTYTHTLSGRRARALAL
jgi:hypothetical protein